MDTTGKEGTCTLGSCKKGIAQETETKVKEQDSLVSYISYSLQ